MKGFLHYNLLQGHFSVNSFAESSLNRVQFLSIVLCLLNLCSVHNTILWITIPLHYKILIKNITTCATAAISILRWGLCVGPATYQARQLHCSLLVSHKLVKLWKREPCPEVPSLIDRSHHQQEHRDRRSEWEKCYRSLQGNDFVLMNCCGNRNLFKRSAS